MDTPNSLDGLLLLASAATTVTEKKKRSRDPLAHTVHELRCSEVSQVQKYYVKRQRTPQTVNFIANMSRRLAANSMAGVAARQPIELPIENLAFDSPETSRFISQEQRRWAIYTVFYSCYDGIDKEFWAEKQVIVGIMNRLGIPRGSRNSVEKVLDNIVLARLED
jgi:hypothetical protein